MDYSIFNMAFDGSSGLLDTLLGGKAGPGPFGELFYFSLIYDFIRHEIKALGFTLMQRGSIYAAAIATALVTMWVFYQGLRIMSGKGDSMMALVINASRVAFIVTAAISMGVGGSAVYDTVGSRLPNVIAGYVTDSAETPEEQIDEALAAMTFVLKTIDVLNVASDPTLDDDRNRAMYMVAIGTAGPAVTAGAMLLFYQAAIALFVGLGPFFILCLIFDQTKGMFQKWLMYGIGTMFSMAILAAMVSICLKAVIAVAAAHWVTAGVGSLLGMNLSSGINSAAMQQGGIGLLLTMLILTIPPMASNFFQGTLGNFMAYTQVDGGSRAGGGGDQRSRYNAATTGGGGGNASPNPSTRTENHSVPPPSSTGVGSVGSAGVVGGGGGRGQVSGDQVTSGSRGAAPVSGSTSPTGAPSNTSQGILTTQNSRGQNDPGNTA